jgi:hypothetical protein
MEREISPLRKRKNNSAKLLFMIYDTLDQINNNSKKNRRERVPLPNTSLAHKLFSSSAIKED